MTKIEVIAPPSLLSNPKEWLFHSIPVVVDLQQAMTVWEHFPENQSVDPVPLVRALSALYAWWPSSYVAQALSMYRREEAIPAGEAYKQGKEVVAQAYYVYLCHHVLAWKKGCHKTSRLSFLRNAYQALRPYVEFEEVLNVEACASLENVRGKEFSLLEARSIGEAIIAYIEKWVWVVGTPKPEAKAKEEMPHKTPSVHGDIILHKGELYYINCMDRKEDGQYARPSFDLLSEYLDALAPATQVWVLDAVRKRLNIESFSVPSKDPT